MDRANLPEIVCQFCQRKLEIPADYNITYECECGARYFVQGAWDDEFNPHEVFGLISGELVEVKIIEKFDVLTDIEGQDPETGEWQHLVFVFPTSQWGELHRIALERMPRASTYKRSAFARGVMALIGAVPLGQGGHPTVREYAAMHQYGQERHTLETAIEILIREDGLIFGPITELHRQCWAQDFQFNGNDPEDVAELSKP